jgi:hypothetical protein
LWLDEESGCSEDERSDWSDRTPRWKFKLFRGESLGLAESVGLGIFSNVSKQMSLPNILLLFNFSFGSIEEENE